MKELISKLGRRLHGLSITVGVQSGKAAQVYANGATVGEVAGFAEMGTSTQPPRPFLGQAFDHHKAWRQSLTQLGRDSLDEDPVILAAILGTKIVRDVQEVIDSGVDPENEPSTIRKKGHAMTLIDTSMLRDSISTEVSTGGRVPAGMQTGEVE